MTRPKPRELHRVNRHPAPQPVVDALREMRQRGTLGAYVTALCEAKAAEGETEMAEALLAMGVSESWAREVYLEPRVIRPVDLSTG